MPTPLTKPVSRETAKRIGSRPVILTIAPCGAQSEARVGVRLKGKRTQYVATLSSLYTMLALWHGNAEKNARREARKSGIPWARAKQAFIAANSIR